MKYLITSLLATLTLSLSILTFAEELHDNALKIYKTDFTQYNPATCDSAKATGYTYRGQINDTVFLVKQIIAEDKTEFVVVYNLTEQKEYFHVISAEGKVTGTQHAGWDDKLKIASPGFYELIHGTVANDCKPLV